MMRWMPHRIFLNMLKIREGFVMNMAFGAVPKVVPLGIFFLIMILGVKIQQTHEQWDSLLSGLFSLEGGEAQAADTPTKSKPAVALVKPPESRKSQKEVPAIPIPSVAHTRVSEASSSNPRAGEPGLPHVGESTQVAPSFDILNLSIGEFQVLQDLAKEQKNLVNQKVQIEKKAHLLKILETRVSEKIHQLEQTVQTLDKLVKQQENQEKAQLSELVKIYENMKPQEAAQILATLNPRITLALVGHMRGSKASAILANLPPAQAGQITTALAQKIQAVKDFESLEGRGVR